MRSDRELGSGEGGVATTEPEAYREMGTKALLRELAEQGKILIKEEVQLAKAELRREAKRAGVAAGLMGGGTVLLHVGLFCLAAFLIALLALWMPVWAAALIVTVVYLGAGAGLALTGKKKLKQVDLKPEETIETLKEDQAWLRSTMRGATSRTPARV